MTPEELRARLSGIAAYPPEARAEHGEFARAENGEFARAENGEFARAENGEFARAENGDDILAALQRPLVPAAVLVPIVLSDTPGVLLTKRTPHLKAHAGQVSFPGGRIDPEDGGPEDAALREAWEEIGLQRQSVELLGRLADYATGTGYRITPVLSIVPPGLTYRPSADEVAAVFELPITVLLDPEAPRRQRQHVRGVWREYWVWPHPDHYIWGATAAILVHLAQRLRHGRQE